MIRDPFQATLDQALAQRAKDEAMLTNTQRDMDRYLQLAPQDLASKQNRGYSTRGGLAGSSAAQGR
ncbi:MAG: hypothetical protein WDM77_19435 [Steroidobacteraceae bacterium]